MELFDRDEGERGRDEGIGRTTRKNDWWIPLAVAAIEWVARRRLLFTSDAVWWRLGKLETPEPSDRRAISGAFKRAVKLGICEETDERHGSVRSICHVAPKPVYRSLIYRGSAFS